MRLRSTAWLRSLVVPLCALIALLPVSSAYAVARANGVVHGAVVAADSEVPLAGVTLKILDMKTAEVVAEALTTDEGKAELGGLPLGLYQVSVVAPDGYAGAAGPLVFFDEENTEAEVKFSLERVVSAPAAGGGASVLGLPTYAALLLLFGAATVVGLAIWQVTKDVTP